MRATYSAFMQSKFFNPAFNSAIFDGPIRIYFAQFHEPMALKVYFSMQQKFADLLTMAKEVHKLDGRNLLVMLYPSKDSFAMSFENQTGFMADGLLDEDTVIGINGPFEDTQIDEVLARVQTELVRWKSDCRPMEKELTL